MSEKRKRDDYTEEFKRDAVDLVVDKDTATVMLANVLVLQSPQ